MKEQTENPKPKPKRSLAEALRGRGRMGVACIGGVLVCGLMGVGNPLSERIVVAEKRLDKAVTRAGLASDVAGLRHQADLYHKRIPRGIDVNDWTQYILEIVRGQNVKLVKMEPKDQLQLGPCRVLAWQIEFEGPYEGLCHVVAGLENGSRIVRIDALRLQTPSGRLVMSMMLRGLTFEKPETPEKEARIKPTASAP